MWKWFLLLMTPGIGPDDLELPNDTDEPADTDDEPVDPDEPADTDDEPVDPDEPPEPAPRVSRAQRDIISARERAQTAERDLATARAELEAVRRGPAPAAAPTQDQVLFQQEEEALRNPELQDWQRYAINANRSARGAAATAQSALQRAEDLADRSTFAALATTKPKLYSAYKDKVEAAVTEARGRGQNPRREDVLNYLVGKDMVSGTIKSTKTESTRPAAPRAAIRSDVSASGTRMSEEQKREKRLENVRI